MSKVTSLTLNINLNKEISNEKKVFIRYGRFGGESSSIDDALKRLEDELKKFVDNMDLIENLKTGMKNLDTLSVMNMKYLAAALIWLIRKNNKHPDKIEMNDDTTKEILSIISINDPPILSDYEQLFTYLNVVLAYRK